MQLIPNQQVSSTDTSPFRHVHLNFRFLLKSKIESYKDNSLDASEIVNFNSQKVKYFGNFSVTE